MPARWGHPDCMAVLIQAGADVNIHNNIDHSTALTQVAYSFPDSFEEDGYFESSNHIEGGKKRINKKLTVEKSVLLLKEAGADLNVVNVKGHTALTAAITVGNMDCIGALVNAGADVNVVDVNGHTALITAAGSGCSRRSQSIRLLLQAGAHVNRTNKLQHNALKHYLTQHSSVSKNIALLLLAAGETLDGDTIESSMHGFVNINRVEVPEFLRMKKLRLSLKHRCRQVIRARLHEVAPHLQLFPRVPLLGLPSSLSRYLLYDMSLEEENTAKLDKYDQVEVRRRKFLP